MKIAVIITILFFSAVSCTFMETKCHPQCSWKCDDPHCPAICDPVCEPPKCHTSCAEPKNAICDVKCEKPECEIKCPDKGCEMFDCPKCVTVCKQPHCVTHCQAPKPECEAVCEEPRCDWKCHKPPCPKPKCELVCENPNCVPKVECCPCAVASAIPNQVPIPIGIPFFKETESNKACCSCNKDMRFKQIIMNQPPTINQDIKTTVIGNKQITEQTTTITRLQNPKQIGTSYYRTPIDSIDTFENRNSNKINYMK